MRKVRLTALLAFFFNKRVDMDIDAIKKRLADAHKGPWRAADARSDVFEPELSKQGAPYFSRAEDDCILGPDGEEVLGCSEWIRVDRSDLEFMAHARQDIEDLLSEIDRLKAANAMYAAKPAD